MSKTATILQGKGLEVAWNSSTRMASINLNFSKRLQWKRISFIKIYLHMIMIEESVSKGQDFGIGSVLVSVCSPFVVPVALTNHV